MVNLTMENAKPEKMIYIDIDIYIQDSKTAFKYEIRPELRHVKL